MKMMGMSTHGCGVDKRQKHHVGEDKMKMCKSDHVGRETISKQLSHQAITLQVCFCKTNKQTNADKMKNIVTKVNYSI